MVLLLNLSRMNNKEFINELATKADMSIPDTQKILKDFIAEFSNLLDEGNCISIQGFGNFEVKKKYERVIINPQNRQRLLVPPKLILSFKASSVLKDKFNGAKKYNE